MAQKITLQIKKVNATMVEGISRKVGETAFAAFSAIIIASPHDTGHFKQNWQVSLNERKTNELEGTDKSGQNTIRKGQPVFANYEISRGESANKIFISNNVPYALRLNEGHSKKAASGFVQRALRAAIKALGTSGKIFKS